MKEYQFKGTPAPWRWELNENAKQVQLCGGKRPYDVIVMDFARYGMGHAAPRFNTEIAEGINVMQRCEHFGMIVEGREHHARWFKTLAHPDAQLISAAPELLEAAIEALKELRYHNWANTSTGRQLEQAIKQAIGL